MTARIISTSSSSGVILAAYDNPVTVAAGVVISAATGAALQATTAGPLTIDNLGTIAGPTSGNGSFGISLTSGTLSASGTLANTGVVSGYSAGVYDAASFTVVNTGSISAGSTTSGSAVELGGGVVTNGTSAAISGGLNGIDLTAGGSVDNQGTISGARGTGIVLAAGTVGNSASVAGYMFGVSIAGAGTVVNSGQIRATQTAKLGYGYVKPAGTLSITSAVVAIGQGVVENLAGGTISGPRLGVVIQSGGSLVNDGLVQAYGTYTLTYAYTVGRGAWLLGGGSVTNNQTGTINGGQYGVVVSNQTATVVNAGLITGHVLGGALLAAGGAVTNAPGGQIEGGFYGVRLNAAATVLNQGTIAANGTAKVKGAYHYDAATKKGYFHYYQPQGIDAQALSTITNAAGATIDNAYVGVWQHAGGALYNAGFVAGKFGVVQNLGTAGVGAVTNAAGGTIQASSVGIDIGGGSATVSNAGSIAAPYGIFASGTSATAGTASNSGTIVSSSHNFGAGIQLKAGGTITNLAGGVVTSNWVGLQIGGFKNNSTGATYAPGGTIINAGTVIAHDLTTGSGAAAWINGPGIVINQTGGTIAGGPYGVVSYNQVTVVNQGYIGGSSFALSASNPGNHDLVVAYPGALFSGVVETEPYLVPTGASQLYPTGTVVTGTLELAAGSAAGTLSGFGTNFLGFSAITLDAGAAWKLEGSVIGQTITQVATVNGGGTVTTTTLGSPVVIPAATIHFAGVGIDLTLANPGQIAGTITGFAVGDTIALAGITDVVSATLGPSNLLQVVESGGGTIDLQFDPAQTFAGTSFFHSTVGGATDLTAPCFAAGTPIRTETGEVPVEALRPGMRVVSCFGGTAPVVWVGHRTLDCRRHARPHDVWPVRIASGAFGLGVPAVPLWLSPDHAVFADGVLVPVRYLVNGRTIVQERRDLVTYFHVELPAHDVILAAGLACESYLDTGNRGAFADGGGAMALHPDFARAAWENGGCAELVLAGPRLVAVRERVLRRAEALGHRRTRLPGLRVMAAERSLPARIAGRHWEVALPAETAIVRLRSRAWMPAETRADETDTRCLGVALGGITLDGALAGSERFGSGWHADEGDWRWTDGDSVLAVDGAHVLGFELVLGGSYWDQQEAKTARA